MLKHQRSCCVAYSQGEFRAGNSKIIVILSLLLSVILMPVSHGQTIRFAHCLAGCPTGASDTNDIIARAIYTLSFNNQTRVADWVSYIVTAGSIGVATNLSREPQADPFVRGTLNQGDYSDVIAEFNLERNYFAPIVSFAGTPYWSDTNYLTNMVPRNENLNRGAWYGLEWAVRNLANRTEALYVVTGPIYDSEKPQQFLATTKQHKVPSGFFKVIATTNGQMSVFSFDQDLPFHVHHCKQLASLEDVERLTGLEFFPEAPTWPSGNLNQQLGCFNSE